MCGRYALYGPHSRHRDHFTTANELQFSLRFNIAPSQVAPVVHVDGTGNRVFSLARWGLVPSWVKDPSEVQHPINAKSETAAIRPMFRQAFRRSRILVPADGFYEWLPRDGKQPFCIRLKEGQPMGIGGLLEHWQGPEGDVATFTILTTDANPLVAKIHDRMPAIIAPENYDTWLDPAFDNVEQLQGLLRPYPERFMEAYPVSKRVNSPQNDGPDLVEEVVLPGWP